MTPRQLYQFLKNQARRAEFLESDDKVFFEQRPEIDTEEARMRVLVERAIVRKVVRGILDAGLMVRLHDYENWVTPISSGLDDVMALVTTSGEQRLYAWDASQQPWENSYTGSIGFECGNSPGVLKDCSTGWIEKVAAEALAFSKDLQEPVMRAQGE